MTSFERVGASEVSGDSSETRICTLDQVPTSQHAEVVTVEGGRGARRHLAQLGIQPGGVLLVVRSAPMGGPILVEVRGSTVAVGRGLACKIRVRLL